MSLTVTYNANGATGGTVPVDSNKYASNAKVTVLADTGKLVQTGGAWAYWCTAANGKGSIFGPGANFNITSSITLYAQWFVSAGLTAGGVTTHFSFVYDSSLTASVANPTGPEPARTNGLIAAVESDYQIMAGWFGGIALPFKLPVLVQVNNLGGGAGWGPPITLKPGSGDVTLCRYLLVAEVVEMFMLSQNQGWFAPDGSNEQSCGEGLSRFLAQQFLVQTGIGVIEPGFDISPSWLNSSLPPSNPSSTQIIGTSNYGSRADYVNNTLEYDHGSDPGSGCAMLFIYYLHIQLGFSINKIIAAAPGKSQASSCLRGVYKKLTGDNADPFPFFKHLLDNAFPPNQVSAVPGPNPDNPWPLGLLSFWGVKDTWGRDEVDDIINHSNGVYPKAFWLMLEGFNKQVTGSSTPSTPVVDFPGVTTTLDPAGISFETDNEFVPQRIRYPYDVDFTSKILPAFPTTGEIGAAVSTSMNLVGKSFAASTEFVFVAGADPYFTNVQPSGNPANENAPWLSADLRVFTATPGLNQHPVPNGPAFASDSTSGAYAYIQALIRYLDSNFSDPSQVDPFDPSHDVIPGQQDALNGDSSVSPFTRSSRRTFHNYNFAVARVRLQGTPGRAASGVKVFFRLWGTQTADTDWNPQYTYLSDTDSNKNPLWPEAPFDNHTIPFFATSNQPNFVDANNPEFGNNGINNQKITIGSKGKQWAYFGCFLNVYDPNFVVNGKHVTTSFPGTHHCLVAEIAYDGAPIRNLGGITMSPENSDKLAQRNLQVTSSDNPGPPAAHRVPQTFDTRLTTPTTVTLGLLSYPDEFMIDWGTTPAGSLAHIYWPAVNSADVIALAGTFYGTQVLSTLDDHTIKCLTTNGVTYVPIPYGTGESLAGLFTVDLPSGVAQGQEFNIVVRKISSRRRIAIQPPPPPPPSVDTALGQQLEVIPPFRDWFLDRYVVGSFQVKIPVGTPTSLLPPEADTLAIFKARLAAVPPVDRWYPVLLRYIGFIAGRVQGLGGDPNQIPPSLNGFPGNIGQIGHIGKVAGLVFDHFGDFEGFLLETEDGEERFYSREHRVRELAEHAWRERLRLSVRLDDDEPKSIHQIIVRSAHA